MKVLKKINTRYAKAMRWVYFAVSLLCLFVLWQIFAVTVFKKSGVVPAPLDVFRQFFISLSDKAFWDAVFSTVSKSLISFALAFVLGLIFSVAAKWSFTIRHLLEPVISVLRSVPTLGVTLIMFIFYSGSTAAIVVGMLITMPMVYQNMYSALTNVDKKLAEMAGLYRVGKIRQFFYIFLPAALPYLFAAVIAGLGLNLKVVIAAEIIGIPRSSIGSYLKSAYSWGNYPAMFMWLLTAVLISFLLEGAVKLIAYLCMPWKKSRKAVRGA